MTASTLVEALEEYGSEAYLLTVSPDEPHTSYVDVALEGDAISCVIGGTALKNVSERPNVTLMWPPLVRGGYNVIVNGVAEVLNGAAGEANVRITKSVLHRPGERPEGVPGVCPSDCRQLTL